ncbi:MAG: hypothetical protein ACRD8Z_02090, partial [Nitrososphaeraceae archaeon]
MHSGQPELDVKSQKNLLKLNLLRIHNTKLSVESLASNICNTKINVSLKTIINMKDKASPLTYLCFPSIVTICIVLGLALFMAHLAAVNSPLVIAQESNETMSLYSNPGVNFEINYPSSWEKREFPVAENSSIIEFLGPSTGIEPRTPSVNVFIFPAGNQSVEQAVTEVIDELEDIQVNST